MVTHQLRELKRPPASGRNYIFTNKTNHSHQFQSRIYTL